MYCTATTTFRDSLIIFIFLHGSCSQWVTPSLEGALEKRLGKKLPNHMANMGAPQPMYHTGENEENEDHEDQYFLCHPGESDRNLVLLQARAGV